MLANGITLAYSLDNTNWTNLSNLTDVPELGGDPEKVETTTLADSAKTYEYGVIDYGEAEFSFKYDNSGSNASYRILRGLSDSKTLTYFKLTFPDGTAFQWSAMINLKLKGGNLNAVIAFTIKMAFQSTIAVADPASALTVTAAKGTTATATKLTVNRAPVTGSVFYVKCGAALTAPQIGLVIPIATLAGYVQYVSPATDVACAAGNNAVVIEVRNLDRMVVGAGTVAAVVVGP